MKPIRGLGLVACIALVFGNDPQGRVEAAQSTTGIWAQLQSPDPAVFAANLRAAGFPDATVGLLVSQQLESVYAARERELAPSMESTEGLRRFWAPEVRAAWLQLQREKSQRLRSVLGVAPDQRAKADWLVTAFPKLTVEARDIVRTITEDYDELDQRVRAEAHGYLLDEDAVMLEYLRQQRGSDLRQVLSEDEVLDYQIQRSRLGSLVRFRMELMEPTPAELRLVYQLAIQHGLETDFNRGAMVNPMKVLADIEDELARNWSPDRMQEYRRSRSHTYRKVFQLAQRLGLPRDSAAKVQDSFERMNKSLQDKFPHPAPPSRDGTSGGSPVMISRATNTQPARALRSGIPPEETAAFVKASLSTHLAEVRAVLGDRGFEEYESFCPWISRMAQGTLIYLYNY